MQGWTTGQLSMPLIILFWLIVLSVQVWTLSRRVADWEASETRSRCTTANPEPRQAAASGHKPSRFGESRPEWYRDGAETPAVTSGPNPCVMTTSQPRQS
jgi:hypothetical protein